MTRCCTPDLSPEPDLDQVAEIALGIAERIREEDLRRLFEELQALAHKHPAKFAQVVMCLAAWFDPNVTTQTLWERVESITRSRLAVPA
ncbi:MAG: hypothetical protein WDA07_14295 [Leucobacter sp.]